MLRNGLSEVAVERADEHIENRLSTMRARPTVWTGKSLRQLLVHRSGLIREPVPGQIEFVHRTFQEYLADRSYPQSWRHRRSTAQRP